MDTACNPGVNSTEVLSGSLIKPSTPVRQNIMLVSQRKQHLVVKTGDLFQMNWLSEF